MEIQLAANEAQLPGLILQPSREIDVEGRGTGKSADIGFCIDKVNRLMPKAVTSITGKTFGQLLTRTLPSSLKILNELGYIKNVNYVIGKTPPSYFQSSYEEICQHKNVLSFANGNKYVLISQAEKGSGRGANTDFEIADETLTLDKEQYDKEVAPTNRGNLEHFGKNGHHPCHLHHGFKYSTSMPTTKQGRWILEYAKYYEEEKGVNLFSVWNRIVMLQLELLDITDPKQFTQCWNEIVRLRQKIKPFVSKDGLLFKVSNAFDNLKFLGLTYIKKSREQMPWLVFLTEIMNYFYDKIENCFYSINEEKQIYYTGYDDKKILDLAIETDFDIQALETKSSAFDRDCNSSQPLEITPDWNSAIALFSVSQSRNYDFVRNIMTRQECHNFLNEFYVKPSGNDNIMIKELCEDFSKYYKSHNCRELHYYRDRYGDKKNPGVLNSQSFNEQAIAYLKKEKWEVIEHVHPGMEPPQSDKYLLWGKLLKEDDPTLPLIRFNGSKCKYTIISMNNAMVKDENGKLVKDKSSERKTSGVLPEEATHFSDAADKVIWTKYREIIKHYSDDFIPVRI